MPTRRHLQKPSHENHMRKVIKEQLELGESDIANIQFDLQSRDEIPKLLMGLQYIYANEPLRDKVFNILEDLTPNGTDPNNGRDGMPYWKILILGTLRLTCNFDYDKLKEIADQHQSVRQMMCHGPFDTGTYYPLQTLKDNVSLLTPEVLGRINQCVVSHGHQLLGKTQTDPLFARCDSFVVETNVHYPTDINLLLDAMRKVITLMALVCAEAGITDWRQSEHNKRKCKKQYRKAQQLKRSTSKDPKKQTEREHKIKEAHLTYIKEMETFLEKADRTLALLREGNLIGDFKLITIERYMKDAHRQIDQISRRIIFEEKIPHDEKVFSIFEQHTEWISKGKACVPQELGLKVCILEDPYGFITHHQVMQKQTDDQIAVPFIKKAKELFPNLSGCSFDKGFYSPENVKELNELLDKVVIPKKGKPSKKEKEIQSSDEFIQARRQHSAIESAINALENHGLDRCPDRGPDAFVRYVSLSVLSRNIQIIGHLIQQKMFKSEKRRNKYQTTRNNNRLNRSKMQRAA